LAGQNKFDFSNPFLPQYNLFDPVQMIEKLIKFKNLLQEIKQMSKMEIFYLQLAINNLPQLK
jgi:hypothetical protein